MQNLLGTADGIAAQGNFYFAFGDAKLGIVDTRDIASVAASVLLDESDRHDGKVYTPTGPRSINMAEAATEIGKVLGREVRYVPVSEEAAREAFLGMGLPPWLAGMTVEYCRAYTAGWGDFTTTHVEDVTGKPARSFATFVADSWPR